MTRKAVAALGLWVSTMACSGGSGTPGADAGMTGGLDVRYDETYVGTGCTLTSCPSGTVLSACNCVPLPRDGAAFDVNRLGCSELPAPGGGAVRNLKDDFCDASGASGPANVGCFMPGMRRAHGTPRMVTLYGWVEVFANGGDSSDIRVDVYQEGGNGDLGTLVGTTMATLAATGSPCAKTKMQYMDGAAIGERHLGFYRLDNVPSETPLVVKTSGSVDQWKPLYTYNVQVLNSEVSSDAPAAGSCENAQSITADRFEYAPRVLSTSDYRSIPLTAALPGGVQSGHGALAGEVHDCDDVRVEYAEVAVRPVPASFVYFNTDPDNPLPVTGRTEGTSILGLYAALDLAPGPVDVSAIGRLGPDLVSLGWYRAKIFADSVTVVTLRGMRSQQAGAP